METNSESKLPSCIRRTLIRSMNSQYVRIYQKTVTFHDIDITTDRTLADREYLAPSHKQSAPLSSLFCGNLVPRI